MRPLLLLAAALLAAGCSSDPPPDRSRPEDRFDISRPGTELLGGQVVVASLLTFTRPDKTLEGFEAKVENRSGAVLTLEFRTVWKDGSDRELGSEPWAPLELAPGQAKVVSADAVNPATRYLKLEVRAKP